MVHCSHGPGTTGKTISRTCEPALQLVLLRRLLFIRLDKTTPAVLRTVMRTVEAWRWSAGRSAAGERGEPGQQGRWRTRVKRWEAEITQGPETETVHPCGRRNVRPEAQRRAWNGGRGKAAAARPARNATVLFMLSLRDSAQSAPIIFLFCGNRTKCPCSSRESGVNLLPSLCHHRGRTHGHGLLPVGSRLCGR